MYPLRDIAPVAKGQLAAWQELAKDWSWYRDTDIDTGVTVSRCASCHIAGWRITDEAGNAYIYSVDDLLALKVAHLRQAHQDQDPAA